VRARFSGFPRLVIIKLIILSDTAILALRALARRVRRSGLVGVLRRARAPDTVRLIYLDLGMYKTARELRFMVDSVLPSISCNFAAYGFEAIREFFAEAQHNVGKRPNVRLIHGAVCDREGTITLHRIEERGEGTSIYREGEGEEVPALRLSTWLKEEGINVGESVTLLRMNIEGAEVDVIRDLLDQGLSESIDGYLGMWDDAAKIDQEWGNQFRELLREHGIRPFTFNGRDLQTSLRAPIIKYEIGTCVLNGLMRLRNRKTTE
jgi:FkbM family methyltransferase